MTVGMTTVRGLSTEHSYVPVWLHSADKIGGVTAEGIPHILHCLQHTQNAGETTPCVRTTQKVWLSRTNKLHAT
jgi:hypothetical protein